MRNLRPSRQRRVMCWQFHINRRMRIERVRNLCVCVTCNYVISFINYRLIWLEGAANRFPTAITIIKHIWVWVVAGESRRIMENREMLLARNQTLISLVGGESLSQLCCLRFSLFPSYISLGNIITLRILDVVCVTRRPTTAVNKSICDFSVIHLTSFQRTDTDSFSSTLLTHRIII